MLAVGGEPGRIPWQSYQVSSTGIRSYIWDRGRSNQLILLQLRIECYISSLFS